MMTFEKVLEVFNDYLNKDSVLEVVNTKRGYTVILSILVDTFSSRISLTMPPSPKPHNTACVLS